MAQRSTSSRCGPKIDDLSPVEHKGLVAIDKRGETVGNDHHCAPARHAHGALALISASLLRIQRAHVALVEDHQLGIDDQRSCNSEALALAAGEVR